MIQRGLLVASILYIFVFSSGSASVPPHLDVTWHEASPSPICTLGSGKTPSESTVTLIIEGVGDPTPLAVVLSIDSSESMNETDHDNKRLEAAKSFVGVLDPRKDKAGLVIWNRQIVSVPFWKYRVSQHPRSI